MKLYFKTTFTTIIPFVVSLFGAYLIGSFMNATFTPAEWTIESRQFMSLCGLGFGFMLYMRLHWEGLA